MSGKPKIISGKGHKEQILSGIVNMIGADAGDMVGPTHPHSLVAHTCAMAQD